MFKTFKIFVVSTIFSFFTYSICFANTEKIKIGLLVPMTGEHKNLGQLIIKSTKQTIKADELDIPALI